MLRWGSSAWVVSLAATPVVRAASPSDAKHEAFIAADGHITPVADEAGDGISAALLPNRGAPPLPQLSSIDALSSLQGSLQGLSASADEVALDPFAGPQGQWWRARAAHRAKSEEPSPIVENWLATVDAPQEVDAPTTPTTTAAGMKFAQTVEKLERAKLAHEAAAEETHLESERLPGMRWDDNSAEWIVVGKNGSTINISEGHGTEGEHPMPTLHATVAPEVTTNMFEALENAENLQAEEIPKVSAATTQPLPELGAIYDMAFQERHPAHDHSSRVVLPWKTTATPTYDLHLESQPEDDVPVRVGIPWKTTTMHGLGLEAHFPLTPRERLAILCDRCRRYAGLGDDDFMQQCRDAQPKCQVWLAPLTPPPRQQGHAMDHQAQVAEMREPFHDMVRREREREKERAAEAAPGGSTATGSKGVDMTIALLGFGLVTVSGLVLGTSVGLYVKSSKIRKNSSKEVTKQKVRQRMQAAPEEEAWYYGGEEYWAEGEEDGGEEDWQWGSTNQ